MAKEWFNMPWTKEDMKAADEPHFAPAPTMVPSDAPWTAVPSLFYKRHWPQHVVNVHRPRYGHDV